MKDDGKGGGGEFLKQIIGRDSASDGSATSVGLLRYATALH